MHGQPRISVLGFGLLLLSLAVSVSHAAPGDGPLTYRYLDRDVEMQPSARFVAVRFLESRGPQLSRPLPLGVLGGSEAKLGVGRLSILSLEPGTSAQQVAVIRSELGQMVEVDFVGWVFEFQSGLTIATDEFLVRFVDSLEPEDVAELNQLHGARSIRRLPSAEHTWVLQALDGDAFAAANRYHALAQVAYAHPDFVHVRRDPVRSSLELEDGSLLLSDGEVVPMPLSGEIPANAIAASMPGTRRLPSASSAKPGDEAPSPSSPITIKGEDFEGAFPGVWNVTGSPSWAPQGYRVFDGSWSGYCVGSSVAPPGPYPDEVNTSMAYGPFSLADAVDARVSFQAWIRTYWLGDAHDDLFVGSSTDGAGFGGIVLWGNWTGATADGWRHFELDLSSLAGEPQVWIVFNFSSDGDGQTEEGIYLDDIVVEKVTSHTDLTSDEYDHLQWGLNNTGQSWGTAGADVRADEAWAVTHGSDTVKIAVLDTGVDLTHPDLAAKLLAGYDATGGGSAGAPSGDDHHGTHCAGIAAAATDNLLGVAGLGWLVKLLPIRIGTQDPNVIQDSWVVDAFGWAVTNGADVLSNSWGYDPPTTAITTAIRNARTSGRGGKGSVVIFSSGNDNGPVSYPADLEATLAIGASSPCDERKSPTSCDAEHWWGSNFGSSLDLLVPGVQMYTTDMQGAAGATTSDYNPEFNGTSSAAPLAAGAAALVLSHSPMLTAAEAECHLQTSAADLGPPGWDSEHGFGRLDTHGALTTTILTQWTITGIDLNGTQTLSACDMVVGPDVTITTGSDITLHVADAITFANNVVIESGAMLTAGRGSS